MWLLARRKVACNALRELDLASAERHCDVAGRRVPGVLFARGATALKRAIFGLMAFFLLIPLAWAGSGPAELNLYDTPAEARWAPFVADMPACEDNGVLSTISGRFAGTQREFWNSNLAIAGFDRVREIGFRSNGLSYIPRRYCVARAAMSDQKERTVVYSVGTQLGIIGNTWASNGASSALTRPSPMRPRARLSGPSSSARSARPSGSQDTASEPATDRARPKAKTSGWRVWPLRWP